MEHDIHNICRLRVVRGGTLWLCGSDPSRLCSRFLRGLHGKVQLKEKKADSGKCCERSLHRESINFMKGVMDECTHMANFSGRFSHCSVDLAS